MNKKTQLVLASLATTLLVAGCASGPSFVELNALTDKIIKASIRDQSHVKVERITATDETNRVCSEADVAGKPLDEKTAKRIEEANLKAIKWPSDGKFIGDWKQGEAIAQSGRGLTWTDSATGVNGGNCYNCHQISMAEISHGTLGPSLHGYAKLKGTDERALREAWAKIWNSKSSNACSNMPRAGHMGILKEKDIQDLMALLFSPDSPVNK